MELGKEPTLYPTEGVKVSEAWGVGRRTRGGDQRQESLKC